jgi:hypothetical protein
MTEQNHRFNPAHDLDRAIDAALAKYSAVEPRAGFEQRILTNLHAQPLTTSTRAWWRWTLAAGTLAIMCVAAALWWNSSKHPNSSANHQAEQTHFAPEPSRSIQAVQDPTPVRRRRQAQQKSPAVAQRNSRLDRFPQPQPLTAEEIALARYAAQFPAEATLIAQSQQEYARESEQKMGISTPDTQGTIEQEER